MADESQRGADDQLVHDIRAAGFDLYAFDFDMTLSNVHCYNSGRTVRDAAFRATHDIPFSDQVVRILRSIREADAQWCIVTFGQPEVVRAYLMALGLEESEVLVRSPLGEQERYSEENRPPADKNTFLRGLMEEFGIASPSNVVLLDDDGRNVQAARYEGFRGANVYPGRGMSVESFLFYISTAK